MGSKFLFFIIFILGIIGVVTYGYMKATPGAGSQANMPKIEISPASYEFGEIEFGKIINYTFKIKNSGNETLEIERIATSCGCTTAEASERKISPGQEVDLLVIYDTAAMGEGPHGKGNQERIIYIKSNDPNNPQINVTISAYVK